MFVFFDIFFSILCELMSPFLFLFYQISAAIRRMYMPFPQTDNPCQVEDLGERLYFIAELQLWYAFAHFF